MGAASGLLAQAGTREGQVVVMAILVTLDSSPEAKALAYFICDRLDEDDLRRRRPRGILRRLWDARRPDEPRWKWYPLGVAFQYKAEGKS